MSCTLCGLDSGNALYCCAGCENVYAILVESGVVAAGRDLRDTELFQRSLKLGLISNRSAASQHGIVAPRIGLIGYHWNFDIEALATPFLERGRIPEVSRLWDYSMPWDITAIQTAAQWDDILVVPPDYKGLEMARDKGDQDNVHNADFDRWIRQSGLFEGPQSFTVGRDRSVVVNVYFKLKPPTTEAGSVR